MVTKITKTIEVCDICEKEKPFHECHYCGKDICIWCKHKAYPGNMFDLKFCNTHNLEIIQKATAPFYDEFCEVRKRALKAIKKALKKEIIKEFPKDGHSSLFLS